MSTYTSYVKSPYKTIKHSTYFDTYDYLLNDFRNKPITFVEIGIFKGGSLFAWRDYFGPQARIIGIDINPEAKQWESHGFEIFIGDQADENFLPSLFASIGPIDIVLDDGGHAYEQQIVTLEHSINFIKDDGMVIIEDTHTSYMDGFGPRSRSFIDYTKLLIDRINMRFSAFNTEKSERRIWSILIFESIVAFKVNRPASLRTSEPTDNDGIDNSAIAIAFTEDTSLMKPSSQLTFLRRLSNRWPLAPIKKLIRSYSVMKNFKANKYFNNK